MKKIMMAAAIALAAISLNAATYNWTSTSTFFDGTGTTGKMADGTTVYLMMASVYDQSTLVSAFATDGAFDTTKAVATATLASGRTADTSVTFSTTQDEIAYLAVIVDSRLYLSESGTAVYQSVGDGTVAFGSQSYYSRYNNSVKTLLDDNDASNGYVGQGWYSAVPEPTSALMLLVGLAGLALKRKIA